MTKFSGLITALAISFWTWFIPLIFLILLVILGIIVTSRKNSNNDKNLFKNIENFEEHLKGEEVIEGVKKKLFFTNKDREFLKKNLNEFSIRIGKKEHYYILAFYHKEKFNIGSAIGGVFWLGYRGMIREVVIVFITIFLLDIVFLNYKMEINIGQIIGAILGTTGNYLYFKSLQRNINKNKKEINGIFGVIFTFCLFTLYSYLWVILITY